MRLGEADRIVTMVTPTHGKVRAVAKGVRKTKSRFGARLEPLSHVSLLCWQGRELDIVTQAEVIDAFRVIREDLDRLSRATTMLEAVDQISQERHANAPLYQMLLGALKVMVEQDSPLVAPAFFLKLVELDGAGPVLDRCVSCGRADDLVAFDAEQGGVLCRDCRRGVPVGAEALSVLRQILGGELASVLSSEDPPARVEVEELANMVLEHHLERRLRSLGELHRLERA
jgi:DNA repair protein RecO (recombination protein O)